MPSKPEVDAESTQKYANDAENVNLANKIVNQVSHEKFHSEVDTISESVDTEILTVRHSATTENSSDIIKDQNMKTANDKRETHIKRSARKSTSEVVEPKDHIVGKLTETIDVDKPKRRGHKPSAEVVQTKIESEPKNRQRKLPERAISSVEAGQNTIDSARIVKVDIHVEFEEGVKAGAHKQTETVDGNKPKRRGRKPLADIADTEEHVEEAHKETVHLENPKRREVSSVKAVKEPSRRRNRKASAEVTDELEPVQLPDKKPARGTRGRKATTEEQPPLVTLPSEVVEATTSRGKTATLRGRKPNNDEPLITPPPKIVEASTSRAKTATRRGRKAINDEPLSTQPEIVEATSSRAKSGARGPKATLAEEEKSVQVAKAAELKSNRRARKASAEVVHGSPLELTEKPTLRARGASADVAAKTDTAAEATSRGRNLPRKNYDETKRRPRKPVASEAAEASFSPLSKLAIPTKQKSSVESSEVKEPKEILVLS
ncbi:hypothetical protein KR044_008849 [Drosophila immigrans]|nr:hypothetical protein KR044_008849 [Drosophila immigrans]